MELCKSTEMDRFLAHFVWWFYIFSWNKQRFHLPTMVSYCSWIVTVVFSRQSWELHDITVDGPAKSDKPPLWMVETCWNPINHGMFSTTCINWCRISQLSTVIPCNSKKYPRCEEGLMTYIYPHVGQIPQGQTGTWFLNVLPRLVPYANHGAGI